MRFLPSLVAFTLPLLVSSAATPAATDAAAAPAASAGPLGLDNAKCETVTLKVPVNVNETTFKAVDDNYSNQTYVSQTITNYALRQKVWTAAHISPKLKTLKQAYTISGSLCSPKKGASKNSSLIVGVHGIGFDSSYWDYSLAHSYSLVRHAASHGYTIFIYDRIGCGKSETPKSGFDVQSTVELAVLRNIVQRLRTTKDVGGRKWSSIVGVGHSYGSAQVSALTGTDPTLLNGAVLTGFSANSSAIVNFLLSGAFSIGRDTLPQLKNKPSTWLATGSVASLIQNFLYPPYFTDKSLNLTRSTEQGVTLGGLLTQGAIGGAAPNFTGPVQVITGAYDLPFCGGDCLDGPNGTSIPDGVKMAYPASRNFTSVLVPNTGHGITTHTSQPSVAEGIINFLIANKL